MVFRFTKKLLSTLLIANIIFAAIMSFLLFWHFRQGAADSFQQAEIAALDKIKYSLEKVYAQKGSWDFLAQSPDKWGVFLQTLPGGTFYEFPPGAAIASILEEHRKMDRHMVAQGQLQSPLRPAGRTDNSSPNERTGSSSPHFTRQIEFANSSYDPNRPKPDRSSLTARVRLVSSDNKLIVSGFEQDTMFENCVTIPLHHEGNEVGFLKLAPLGWLEKSFQEHLGNKIEVGLIVSAAIAFCFSLVVALPLGHVILKPVQNLILGVRQLAEGHFGYRIQEAGNDEFGDLISNVNNLGFQLEETERLRKSMMADVSHELRTPIAVMQAEVEAIQDGIRPCNQEQMDSLHKSVTNLSRLVNDLFTLSLADAGEFTCQRVTVDISELLHNTAALYENLFVKKNIAFTTTIPDNIQILGDSLRLIQVFSNLFNNSYHYTNKNGTCAVSLVVNTGKAVVTVADSAPGLNKEGLRNMFERYFRTDKSRSRAHGGAGLGLSLCKTIVEAHDGEIAGAESSMGGVAVTVMFPLKKR